MSLSHAVPDESSAGHEVPNIPSVSPDHIPPIEERVSARPVQVVGQCRTHASSSWA
jgi:hypothetical protein